MRTERMTITELEQIRQRAEAATEGVWRFDGENTVDSEIYLGGIVWRDEVATRLSDTDGAFIANARQDVPALLTEVETLITEKAAARRMLDELIGEMANAAEAGYALADPTILRDLEKIRKELIDHGE